jgi:hypothetical protein
LRSEGPTAMNRRRRDFLGKKPAGLAKPETQGLRVLRNGRLISPPTCRSASGAKNVYVADVTTQRTFDYRVLRKPEALPRSASITAS